MKSGRFFACLAMVGAGAIAGTLSGGYTNAARSPDAGSTGAERTTAVVRVAAVQLPDTVTSNVTTVARTVIAAAQAAPATSEPAPAAVIALRFPALWQQQAARASTGDNDPPPQTLAYAVESQREPAATSSVELASIDADPDPGLMPKRMARPEKPKAQVLFNDAQLASIKARLRLTRDQEQYWPQVEQALRAISWKLATQQNARGRQPLAAIDPNSPEVSRLKSAAVPLIMSMREEQKQEVRQLAHTMGLKQVAAMF